MLFKTFEENIKQEEIESTVKHGLWKTFDKNGKLIKTEKFEFGKLIEN